MRCTVLWYCTEITAGRLEQNTYPESSFCTPPSTARKYSVAEFNIYSAFAIALQHNATVFVLLLYRTQAITRQVSC